MIYGKFFLTKGIGKCNISSLNALDKALLDAGIAQCNLVPVSSILSPDCEGIDPVSLPAGNITHCVIASIEGITGKPSTAGIGYAFLKDREGNKTYGIVAEDSGHYDEKFCGEKIRDKVEEMVQARDMVIIDDITINTITIEHSFGNEYSHALSALIYVE